MGVERVLSWYNQIEDNEAVDLTAFWWGSLPWFIDLWEIKPLYFNFLKRSNCKIFHSPFRSIDNIFHFFWIIDDLIFTRNKNGSSLFIFLWNRIGIMEKRKTGLFYSLAITSPAYIFLEAQNWANLLQWVFSFYEYLY